MASDNDFIECKNWSMFHDDPAERQHERLYWCRVGMAVAIAICLAVILGPVMGCATAPAESVVIPVHVVEHEGVKMRMLPTPCKDAISLSLAKQMSPAEYHQRWKATSSDWKMRDGTWQEFAGCWLEVDKEVLNAPDNVFFFSFSDGASGQVLKGELLKPRGQGA